MSQTRSLAAILAADVAGYSRLMGADEEGTLERLKALRRELLDPKIAEHKGRIVGTTGDEPLTRETTKLKTRVLMVVILPHSHDIIKVTAIRFRCGSS
jgi:class 3 adenylate cyclase